MRMINAVLLGIIIFGSVIWGGGCAHPNTSQLSASGRAANTADQIVLRVNELENATIDAASKGAITSAQARPLVVFCVDADKTLKALPQGWQASLKEAWALAKAGINVPATSPLFGALAAVDLVVGAL